MAIAESKVPGGKLVSVSAEKDGEIFHVMLSGDFFMHPEEGVHILERALSGTARDEPLLNVEAVINETLALNDIRMYGIDKEIIIRLYETARSMESNRAKRL